MKWILIAITVWLCLATEVSAQQGLSVNINRASLTWQWVQGTAPTDGMVEVFEVKCGAAPGNYSTITNLANPAARSVPVAQVIKGSGQWYCVVAAVNKYGSSPNSNEVGFDAGVVPSQPTNLGVLAQ